MKDRSTFPMLERLGFQGLEMELAQGIAAVLTRAAVTAWEEMRSLPPTFRKRLVIEGAFAEALDGLVKLSEGEGYPPPPSN